MNSLGETIKKLRAAQQIPLREVTAAIEVDEAILSKIERGQRKATREQVIKLAKYFKVSENDLLVVWLSDKVVYEVQDEEMGLKALQAAEEKVTYTTFKKADRDELITKIKKYFQQDGRVAKAWIFGSFARGDAHPGSDIDIMVSYSKKASGTLFDYADIQYKLQLLLNRKIDLVEKGYVKTFAWNSIKNDLKLIYG